MYSLAIVFHTALASHSGESSVKGVISPVICPRAEISALAERVIDDSPVENATAHNVQVVVSSILLVPFAYSAPTASPVTVRSISQIPVADTTSDRSAVAVRFIASVPSQLTHITAVPDCDRLISENATTYQALRGSIHPLEYHTGNPH